MSDDINLYRYVANSPVKYVDRMGLEKVLTLIGKSFHSDNDFEYGINYQIKKYLAQGINLRNILVRSDIYTPDDFNNVTQDYKGNIQDIVYFTHASEDALGHGLIDKENVNQLKSLKSSPGETIAKLTLIACNAGRGDDSIAQHIANSLEIEVEAANAYVSVDKIPTGTLQDIFLEDGKPTLFNRGNIFSDWSENKFLTFNPQ